MIRNIIRRALARPEKKKTYTQDQVDAIAREVARTVIEHLWLYETSFKGEPTNNDLINYGCNSRPREFVKPDDRSTDGLLTSVGLADLEE